MHDIDVGNSKLAIRIVYSGFFILFCLDIQEALSQVHKQPAGYTFLSQYYFKTWGRSSNRSDLILQSYIQREDRNPRLDNQKNIYTPRLIAYGKVHTHNMGAAKGYKM